VFRIVLTIIAAALVVAAPLKVGRSGSGVVLSSQTAAAKDGDGKGGGKSHGNGGDNGKSGGNGKGDGGKGKSNGGTATSDEDDDTANALRSINPATGDSVTIRGKSIAVQHRNGMRESVKGGRYLMTDDKGRTIVERAATNADLRRLRKLRG